jgi:hypothetical protein
MFYITVCKVSVRVPKMMYLVKHGATFFFLINKIFVRGMNDSSDSILNEEDISEADI